MEKYFLSDEVQKRLQITDPKFEKNIVGTTKPKFRTIGQRDLVYQQDSVMGTLVATDYKQPKQILADSNEPIHIADLCSEKFQRMHEQSRRVYSEDGIAPAITATNEELVRMKKYYEDLEKEFDFSGAQKNATKKLSTYTDSSKYTSEFIERVNSKIGEIKQLDITKPEDVVRLKTIDNEVQKIVDDSKLLENKLVKQDSKITDIISQMKIFRSQNTNMSSSQKQNLDSVIKYAEELKNAGKVTAQEIEKIKISFSGLKAEVASTGNMGKNFFNQIGNRLTDMNSKFVAQFLSWQDWIRYLQQGFNLVNEINKSVTELRKVSDGTESDLNNALEQATVDAKDLGSSISNIVSLQADWARLGYSIPDAEKLAKTTQL